MKHWKPDPKKVMYCAQTGKRLTGAALLETQRWNFGIDRLLNSGLCVDEAELIFQFVDGNVTVADFLDRMPP